MRPENGENNPLTYVKDARAHKRTEELVKRINIWILRTPRYWKWAAMQAEI